MFRNLFARTDSSASDDVPVTAFSCVYGIYDIVGQRYIGNVFPQYPNDAAACRFFTEVCNNPQTEVHAHPSDYALLCIGYFNFDSVGNPVFTAIDSTFNKPVLAGSQVDLFNKMSARSANMDVPSSSGGEAGVQLELVEESNRA